MPILNFQYGGGAGSVINEQAAVDAMYARNCLWNRLVEIDRANREQYNAIVSHGVPEVERLNAISQELKGKRDALKLLKVPVEGEKTGPRSKQTLTPERKQVADYLKAVISALEKERTDIKPVADVKKKQNRALQKDELSKLEAKRRADVTAAKKQAMEGYGFTDKQGNQRTVVAVHEYNAEDVVNHYETARKRAMQDKAVLQFHRFTGEGRLYQRIHSDRDFTGVEGKVRKAQFDTIMQKIDGLRAAKKAEIELATGDERKAIAEKYRHSISQLDREADAIAPLRIGITEDELFSGKHTGMRVDRIGMNRDVDNPTIWDKALPRSERRRQMQTTAHIRIESRSKEKPEGTFVSVPVMFHRPLPVGGRVVGMGVNRKKLGRRFLWSVTFTVIFTDAAPHTNTGIIAAIDLGWAQDSLASPDGRIRVAGVRELAADGSESFYDICLPADYAASVEKYNSIQSTLAKHTNEALALLAASAKVSECSEQLQQLFKKAELSRSKRDETNPPMGHLRSAVYKVRHGEQAAQEVIGILEQWYERYHHLNEWLQNGRDHLRAWRNDFYRRRAHDVAQKYDKLLIDADDFSAMAEKPKPETGKDTAKGGNRVLSGVSIFRQYLVEEFGDRRYWSTQKGTASSQTCSRCGNRNTELGMARTFTCPRCGHAEDRESNATANLIKAYVKNPGLFSNDKKAAGRLAELNEKEEQEALAAGV